MVYKKMLSMSKVYLVDPHISRSYKNSSEKLNIHCH